MNVYKSCFSYYFIFKNSYNLKKYGLSNYETLIIKINPKLKYFEIIMTF